MLFNLQGCLIRVGEIHPLLLCRKCKERGNAEPSMKYFSHAEACDTHQFWCTRCSHGHIVVTPDIAIARPKSRGPITTRKVP